MRKLSLLFFSMLFSCQLLAANDTWTQYQGNAAHTGYVNTTVDPAAIRQLWRRALTIPEGTYTRIGQPIVTQNKLFLNVESFAFSMPTGSYPIRLLALDTSNGELRWEETFDYRYIPSALAYENQKLYFILSKVSDRKRSDDNILLASYNAETGKQIYAKPIPIHGGYMGWNVAPPVIDNHQVLIGSTYIQVSADAETGNMQWRSGDTAGAENIATLNKDYVMRIMHNAISIMSRKSGEFVKSIAGCNYYDGRFDTHAPLIMDDDQRTVYGIFKNGKHTYQLTAFDVERDQKKWALETSDKIGQPVIANHIIYFTDGSSVHAINAVTGEEVWNRLFQDESDYDPIVTNNALILRGNNQVMIISLESHEIMKIIETNGKGYIAVTNNVLYVVENKFVHETTQIPYISAYALN